MYPDLVNYWNDSPAEPSNIINNNVFVQTKILINKRFEKSSFLNNWETNEDPGFIDINKQQFGFKSDAKVFDKILDFKNIPFERIGLIRN